MHGIYIVDHVVAERQYNGVRQVKIRWVSWGADGDTWEPYTALSPEAKAAYAAVQPAVAVHHAAVQPAVAVHHVQVRS